MTVTPNPTVNKRLLTLRECVDGYGLTIWWWRQRLWNGDLPYISIGRKQILDAKDIEFFLDKNKVRSPK